MAERSKPTLYRYRFGAAEFDEARFELRVAGLPVDIQRKPLEVLALLLAHAGEVVTREELLDSVWQGRPTVDNVVANAVAKLRSALNPEGAGYIITQPRVGYRFHGPLERSAVGRQFSSQLDLAPGMGVPARPNFVLREPLGGSRNNEVWLARHAKTGEPRVYKFSPGGERLADLKREATLYRVLRENLGERADIARIIDWNFEAPPFFLECAYAGQSLLAWSTGAQGLASLTREARLALFLQIADAVAAAHSVGVLHKDLKPANILIHPAPEGGWQLCLSDFGSGRLLESARLGDITGSGLTTSGAVLDDAGSGTPHYLAPELLAGQPPTVQSDLYALGIILYQCLVGDLRRPMAPGWERDVDDPLLCQDLSSATDGDPGQRLGAVSDLVTRLRTLTQRCNAQQQQAQATAQAQQAQRALQRSRARRPWLAATLLTLLTGLGASLYLYRQASISSERLQAVNDFLYRDVLANTGALKTDSDPDPGMRRVLRHAADTVGERFAGDPGSEGWIRNGIAQGLTGLGDYAAAEQQQRLAVDLLGQAHGPGHPRTLLARRGYAMLLLEQSRFDEAEAVLSAVDDLQRNASAVDAEDAFVLQALRGMLRAARKDCRGALGDLRSAQAIALPPSPEATYNLFNVRSWIGEALNCLGQHREALAHYQQLLDKLLQKPQDAEALGPALIAYARLGQAQALQQTGQAGQAETTLQAALDQLERGVGDSDPFTLGQALVVAGRYYLDAGELARATGYLERGRQLLLGVDERQEKALNALRMLASIDYCQGRLQNATLRLGEARAALLDTWGPNAPDTQAASFWLAATLLAGGDSAAANSLGSALDADALALAMGGAGWVQKLATLRRVAEAGEPGGADRLPQALCPAPEPLRASGSASPSAQLTGQGL
ncbi:protein kinase domain-containing protein [Parahaliea mediterranea]|uniref:protein kinase domain-containing protein n=1 Tax=Parahaliea mediterranea TaxID=651086 RepID=UPI000E2F9A72|nr:winged helix-turn-helix domain-containing protein [Parahaliea mediterranea]